ncbi:MAG: hypothetical protein V3U15_03450, partial [Nitrospinota bacterium]
MKKILLIEDEKDTIKTLSTALKLEDEEYEISSAEDGRSGLELARKQAGKEREALITDLNQANE